jgi:hypothetical protein
VTKIVVVAPLIVVVIIPAWPNVAASIMSSPSLQRFPHCVRHTIVPVKDSAGLAVRRSFNPPTILQEGQVLHNLQVVAQHVDLSALEADRFVVMRMAPVRLGDREQHLHRDVRWVGAPNPEVE